MLKIPFQYAILLGQRSNGKSYSVKCYVIDRFIQHGEQFIYLKRYAEDIKTALVNEDFEDMEEYISKASKGAYDGIEVHAGRIYLTLEGVKLVTIGFARALSNHSRYKGGQYTKVKSIVFEEFISNGEYYKGLKEPGILMQFVSTISRLRDIKVFMLGNTLSRLCPYFSHWELTGTLTQEQGTIQEYIKKSVPNEDGEVTTTLIAVEYCKEIKNDNRMFFGKASAQIKNGVWESEEKPKITHEDRIFMKELYRYLVIYDTHKYDVKFYYHSRYGSYLFEVAPYTKKVYNRNRVITHMPSINPYSTIGMIPLNRSEEVIFKEFEKGNIYYSDDLTGTEFTVALKEIRKISIRKGAY